MKNKPLKALSLSLLFVAAPLCAKENDPVQKLATTIEESIFPPSSPISLTHEEIGLITNSLLLLYADTYYTLRSYEEPLTEEQQRKHEVITQSLTHCLNHLAKESSPAVHSAITAIRYNCNTLCRTYLRKHQDELRDAMQASIEQLTNENEIVARAVQSCQEALETTHRTPDRDDNGVALFNAAWSMQQECDKLAAQRPQEKNVIKKHAASVQRMNLNVYSIWYQVLYNGMKERKYEPSCFDIVFANEGYVPAQKRSTQLPAPESIMIEVAS